MSAPTPRLDSDADAVVEARAALVRRRLDRRRLADNGIYLAFALIVVLFALNSDAFLSIGNAVNVGRQATLVLLAGYAMTFVIISGEIDLSVGANATLVGVATATLLASGTSPLVAVVAGLALGTLVGAVNGALIVLAGLPSFIVTLGSFYALQGVARTVTGGSTVTYSADGFRAVFATGFLAGIPTSVWIVLLVGVGLHVLLRHTPFGSNVYAVGGDAASAAMVGLRVRWTKFWVFTLSGALLGLAAMGPIARVGNARPDALIGLEFDAIAAVVIGGTSFSGGRGSLPRTVIGALLIAVVNNGLTLLNVPRDVQLVIKGCIIIAAVLLDRWAAGRST
ncbi:MAG: ABC transporter permease [Nitriliruptoraceae bacterium]|nr:ABC transporter permease [Nitriliruptoraceae bacterium]